MTVGPPPARIWTSLTCVYQLTSPDDSANVGTCATILRLHPAATCGYAVLRGITQYRDYHSSLR